MTEYKECEACGRQLKDIRSIKRGYGPVCYKKHLKAVAEENFRKNQITIYDVVEGNN
jgi:Family of unknown function (DUF6011)